MLVNQQILWLAGNKYIPIVHADIDDRVLEIDSPLYDNTAIIAEKDRQRKQQLRKRPGQGLNVREGRRLRTSTYRQSQSHLEKVTP